MADEDLKAELERLRAENEALKKPAGGRVYLKVSEKGGLSVYGMGRFPVTLYREQWEKLLGMADEIRAFYASVIPMNRMGQAEEVANAALFLASDAAAFISGVCLVVDGAMSVAGH